MPFASEAQRDYEVMIEGDDRGGSVAVMARVKVVNVGTCLVAKFYGSKLASSSFGILASR